MADNNYFTTTDTSGGYISTTNTTPPNYVATGRNSYTWGYHYDPYEKQRNNKKELCKILSQL